MKSNVTHALGYVDGRAVFVGAELEQLTRKGWVRHNAQESWRGQSIDWKNDFRWPAEGTKPLFKLDRLDDLIHQLINVTSDLHRSIQPDPNITTKDSVRSLSPCDECAGTGSIGPDSDPTEMNCEVCDGTGKALMGCVITDAEIDMLAINNCLRIEVVEGTALRIFDLEHQRKFARAYGQLCRDTASPASSVTSGACQHSFQKFEGPEGETACEHCKELAPTATKPASTASTASIGDDAGFWVRVNEVVIAETMDARLDARRNLAVYIDARQSVAAPEAVQGKASDAEARYEFVRKLHPVDFATLYSRSLAGEGSFDALVDAARAQQQGGKA